MEGDGDGVVGQMRVEQLEQQVAELEMKLEAHGEEAPAIRMDSDTVLMQGYMMKKGNIHTGWKKRLFMLTQDASGEEHLRYFEEKGAISMDKVTSVSRTQQRDHGNMISITTREGVEQSGSSLSRFQKLRSSRQAEQTAPGEAGKRVYYLDCLSADSQADWVHTLNAHLSATARQGATGHRLTAAKPGAPSGGRSPAPTATSVAPEHRLVHSDTLWRPAALSAAGPEDGLEGTFLGGDLADDVLGTTPGAGGGIFGSESAPVVTVVSAGGDLADVNLDAGAPVARPSGATISLTPAGPSPGPGPGSGSSREADARVQRGMTFEFSQDLAGDDL